MDNRGGFRGSVNRGEYNPSTAVSNNVVERIRREYFDGHASADKLSIKYGVSASSVKRMLLGVSFRDAGGPTFTRLLLPQERVWGHHPREFLRDESEAAELRKKGGA